MNMCTSIKSTAAGSGKLGEFLLVGPAWLGPLADRIVAEWMLRMGAKRCPRGQRRPITDLADLPTPDSASIL